MDRVVVISVVMAVTSSPARAALRTVIADNQTADQDVLGKELQSQHRKPEND